VVVPLALRLVIRVETHGPLTFLRLARRVLGRPAYWTGAYFVEGMLVDCGPPATARELLRFLEGRAVHGLLITHHHEDHMGAAALVRERRGVVARAHPAALPLMAGGFAQEAYRRLAWGRPPRIVAEPLVDEVVAGSLRLRPIPTPGHSPDHLCLYEPDRGWLFTGDLFLAERLRFLRSDEDLDALIRSLETVARLPLREVLCAHRGPVRDGPAALRRKAETLRSLRERIADLLRQGLPEREIARRVVGREGFLTWLSRGRFSARNFVRAVARKPSG
jgi:glyoxylase-like metal-dependent hydrolase (beta-lactamase superfamily II)